MIGRIEMILESQTHDQGDFSISMYPERDFLGPKKVRGYAIFSVFLNFNAL